MLPREAMLKLEKWATMDAELARLVAAHHSSSASSLPDAQPPSTPPLTLLLQSIQEGDLATVRRLIELGVNVEAGMKHDDMAPMTAACMGGHLEIVKFLFAHGARTGVYSRKWATPLYQACRYNHYDVVQWLVESAVEAYDINLGAAATPLGIAVIHGHLRIAKFLIARGANTQRPTPNKDVSLRHLCAAKGNMAVLKYLVENGIGKKQGGRREGVNSAIAVAARGGRVEMVEYLIWHQDADAEDITACLHVAIKAKQLDIVEFLVMYGADVNTADADGKSPLYHAVYSGRVDVASILLVHGADVHQRASHYRYSAIHEMANCGQLEMIKAGTRITKGFEVAKLNMPSGRRGEVSLHKAAASGQSAVVRYLLQMLPTIVDVLDSNQSSPLLYAAMVGCVDVVRILVEHGAVINCGPGLPTSLCSAAGEGHYETVQCLCENGADVNLAHGGCYTPLITAARNGRLDVVEYLLEECHADANLQTTDGKTALGEAVTYGFEKIARVLLAHSAQVSEIQQGKSDLLCHAAIFNKAGMAKLLLSASATVNARCSTTVEGYTMELIPLTLAASCGHFELVKCLCEHGADVEMTTEQHESPLFLAALFGRLDVVMYLVDERNANLESADSCLHYSPVEMAKCVAASNIVEFLLAKGAAAPDPANFLDFNAFLLLLSQRQEIAS